MKRALVFVQLPAHQVVIGDTLMNQPGGIAVRSIESFGTTCIQLRGRGWMQPFGAYAATTQPHRDELVVVARYASVHRHLGEPGERVDSAAAWAASGWSSNDVHRLAERYAANRAWRRLNAYKPEVGQSATGYGG